MLLLQPATGLPHFNGSFKWCECRQGKKKPLKICSICEAPWWEISIVEPLKLFGPKVPAVILSADQFDATRPKTARATSESFG